MITQTQDLSISIVIPVYNSEDCLNELSLRLNDVLDRIGKDYEIILVNDSSQDNSWREIVKLCEKYIRIKGISLRKNFGVDNALMAGINYARGEIIILMDDDLQHDPADIPYLLNGLERGNDVCYGKFFSMKQSRFKKLGSWVNDKFANIIFDKPKYLYLSGYKAIKREIIDEIIKYDGPYPYIDGLVLRVTRNITQEDLHHNKRYAGKGNYNLKKSIKIWLKMATSFSVLPLRFATFLGFMSSSMGFMLSILLFFQYFIGEKAPPGWFTLVMVIIFLGGIQLITIGIIGEYIGRSFLHLNKNPQFVVDEIIGGLSSDS